ncbi:cupin domain-containing protein [Baekduia soli]|uniref:Cupin domain-containing protein n=1 Tax=Baekduia soli TaxID=496014 RepID=A0A5B8U8V6_9ACTN|nr:cupin domain-containing protein [Baekduia soli]QEC49556.1 cupin domain-containing protein [Baekduia soli]
MHHLNVAACEFEYDDSDPAGYRCGVVRAGALLAAKETAIKLYEIPPGESLCPYHYEYAEEWLFVIEGEVAVRTPDGEQGVRSGALVCFSAGPDGAHKLTNRSAQPSRVILFSSSREPAIAVYPDSDKIGVWPGDDRDSVMLRRSDGDVPYYDGEV